MLIVCPQCATSYQVDLPALGAGGRSVRCARCKTVWFATAPTVVPALATAEDLDIVDKGPKVPTFEAPPRATEPEPPELAANLAPSAVPPDFPPEEPTARPETDAEPVIEAAATNPEEAAPEAAPGPAPGPASIDGIDVESLRADIEAEHSEQAAAADAVLADVAAGQITVEAPPLTPPMEPAESAAQPAALRSEVPDHIEKLAARPRRKTPGRRALPGLPTLILALVAANTAIAAWRTDIVRFFPQTAPIYAAIGLPVNLRGLDFENVTVKREQQEGLDVLVVEGSILNVAGRPQEVPRIRVALRNQTHGEVYAWTTLPTRAVLGPRESLPFRARLASPPRETHEILVRFLNRRDAVAGLR